MGSFGKLSFLLLIIFYLNSPPITLGVDSDVKRGVIQVSVYLGLPRIRICREKAERREPVQLSVHESARLEIRFVEIEARFVYRTRTNL